MRLQDVMSTPLEVIPADATADAAWEKMRIERVRHLGVVEDGRLVGVITDLDLGGPKSAGLRTGRSVADLMTRTVVTAAPTTTVREAANLLRGRGIGCLPILKGKKPVGMVTVSDLLDLIGRGAERPVARTKRWTLKHRGPRKAAGDKR